MSGKCSLSSVHSCLSTNLKEAKSGSTPAEPRVNQLDFEVFVGGNSTEESSTSNPSKVVPQQRV